jgi:subtilisin-like proprotein convertase family protein
MKKSLFRCAAACAVGIVVLLISVGVSLAFQVRPKTSRFDALVIENPTNAMNVSTTPLASLQSSDPARAKWDGFKSAHGPSWSVYLDRRSGAPLLVEGAGIRFAVDANTTVDSLGGAVRHFIEGNSSLLLADNRELVLDREASGQPSPHLWQIVFARAIAGVPVVGEKYTFTIGHGNLMSFGATRWSPISINPFPEINPDDAMVQISAYLGLPAGTSVKPLDKGTLQIITMPAIAPGPGGLTGPYDGAMGEGTSSALVWRVVIRVEGEIGTWEALVDAHTGAIRSFNDINDYAQAKGGVFPVSNDGIAPDGVEQPGWPMPFANITIGAATSFSTSSGGFTCAPGGSTATTTLAGQYVKVQDTCGPISKAVTCDSDLDLGASAGTDCVIPAGGGGAGNTHSARSSFYHLNRIAEHGRYWLPSRPWLTAQLTDNVNLNQTCNAYWLPSAGTVNFFRSGGGCANTGEIAGVFLHEWGHGMDSNDGGGTDNPGEAYGDITAMMSTHVSCIGRGFEPGTNCSGYGDACLNCTGIRDQDWDQHASHQPFATSGHCSITTATTCVSNAGCPAGQTCTPGAWQCSSGGGPCSKEVHCEGYTAAETLWDLATRDLPAAGFDLATSWQIADKLWYKSRLGSGGNAYNCALPNSDGCAATSWFSKLRNMDDDDGNLANGTPHAAAIFAAFNRHKIACGLAGDASNQSTTACPALASPTLNATAGSGSAVLTWNAVSGAVSYNVLRNDASCAAGSTIVGNTAALNFTDGGLANGFTEYYRVQAVAAGTNCEGALSNCQAVIPQPFAGVVKLDAGTYSCAGTVNITVTDANIGSDTTTVSVTSGTEPGGETVTVTRVAPGSANYAGTITTTSAPAAADGLISVANGDTITATYIDADDGQGGSGIIQIATANVDCVFPIITNVQSSNVTGNSARVTWNTNENSTSVVHYGLTTPPGSTTAVATPVTAHTVDLAPLAECSNYFYSVESADGVGNAALDNNGGFYYTFTTGKNTNPSFPSTDTPVSIPDNNATGATSTITVTDNKPVQKVVVKINITHTYDADLTISLIPPVGASITLSALRGGSADNFTNTVFDDAAATAISAGTAPFTGSFRPETPLSAANGINAAGAWKLKVVDSAGIDVGTIDNWTLTLLYPAAACGPHAAVASHASVTDTCGTGGPGNGDGRWDAGEQVSFSVTLNNDGTDTLTGVTGTVSSTTPGVFMVDGVATYADIVAGSTGVSQAPHFTVFLPAGLACGSTVSFNIAVHSNQGDWNGTFSHAVGLTNSGNGSALNESFSAGIPATWTIVDGGSGGGAAATWTTANPGARAISAPLSAPVAIVDSDNAGNTGATQDEELITPAMDLSTATTVTLQFDQYFRWYVNGLVEVADVDVRSSITGGAWVNILRQQGAASPNPDHKTLDITAQAAGAANVQVRFHYYNARFEWYWMIDNVKVDFSAPAGCNQNVCLAAPGIAKPVADGSYGTAMTGSRGDVTGTVINLTWDVSTCSSTDHHVVYGDLANVSTALVSGGYCNLGASGSSAWSGVPAGNLWFVVVGDNDGTTEGSWGTTSSGERGGGNNSGTCGVTTRDNSASCP